MYGQDLDFVVVIGVLVFSLLVLFTITASIVEKARRRRERKRFRW